MQLGSSGNRATQIKIWCSRSARLREPEEAAEKVLQGVEPRARTQVVETASKAFGAPIGRYLPRVWILLVESTRRGPKRSRIKRDTHKQITQWQLQ